MNNCTKNFVQLFSLTLILGILFGDGNAQVAQSDIVVEKDIVFATIDGFELTLDVAYPKEMITTAPAFVDCMLSEHVEHFRLKVTVHFLRTATAFSSLLSAGCLPQFT